MYKWAINSHCNVSAFNKYLIEETFTIIQSGMCKLALRGWSKQCFYLRTGWIQSTEGDRWWGSSGKDNASTNQLRGGEIMSSSFYGCQAWPDNVMSRWFLQKRGTDMTVAAQQTSTYTLHLDYILCCIPSRLYSHATIAAWKYFLFFWCLITQNVTCCWLTRHHYVTSNELETNSSEY